MQTSLAYRRGWILAVALLACAMHVRAAAAQHDEAARGSRNVAVEGRLALEGGAGYVEIEQEPARPFAYVARRSGASGFDVVSLKDPAHPQGIFSWRVDEAAARGGADAQDLKYFKLDGRYYLVQAVQAEGGPDADLAAVVFDVTGLPDGAQVREAARIRAEGGFHNLFAYRHSDGRVLLLATGGGDALVFDMARLLAGEAGQGLAGRIATPEQLEKGTTGFHYVFAAFHPDSQQDRFYGAGAGGYHVFDVTDPDAPVSLTSVSDAAVRRGHAIAPSPDGRYLVTAAEYRTAPLRIYDLQPVFDGEVRMIRTALGAWTADWRNFAQHFEVRWPYVFVAALEDGFQVFNMREPEQPYTLGFYRTYDGPPPRFAETTLHGAWSLDVRNADGLVVVGDLDTGLWTFRLEAFEGWSGHGWGVPDVSSAQHWDEGPR